jgi:hypothetical protein
VAIAHCDPRNALALGKSSGHAVKTHTSTALRKLSLMHRQAPSLHTVISFVRAHRHGKHRRGIAACEAGVVARRSALLHAGRGCGGQHGWLSAEATWERSVAGIKRSLSKSSSILWLYLHRDYPLLSLPIRQVKRPSNSLNTATFVCLEPRFCSRFSTRPGTSGTMRPEYSPPTKDDVHGLGWTRKRQGRGVSPQL